ncbi:uncharacterized protein si:dkeyp-13a3.10 [Austrofundulus limnaeus]|uniref:Uncharacterized protein si:dkeyp-13a3.10 n=1 Tax=Austrofundulus limnaeus TaxID=52670 RepID=A0A2I4D389_AUSLI|nr:PREDICTED: uncharacterized protein LOC106534562 [Austrofundulus limnaeus]
MPFCLVVLFLICHCSGAVPLFPLEATIVQIQQRGVVGAQQVTEQVLVNGVSLVNPSEEVKSIVQSMSAGALLTAVNINKTSPQMEHRAILRSRDCIQEGPRPHWTDRMFYDGKVYLSLEHNDTWTAHVPQAMALKVLLDEQVERTRAERVRLQEGCIQLMKKLSLSQELPASSSGLDPILILIIVLAFLGLILLTFCISKNLGSRHPGGVIGSIIHYPPKSEDEGFKCCEYNTL